MEEFPHRYRVKSTAQTEGDVSVEGERLPSLLTAPPEQFDGPGDRWSPETLLVAAVAGCFVLTFRAVARASRIEWLWLSCEVEGTLDRVRRVTQFTSFSVLASLSVPPGTNAERAQRVLEKAEETCIVTNSLKAPVQFEGKVEVSSP